MKLNMQSIDNRSLRLDLKTRARTLPIVLTGPGAK